MRRNKSGRDRKDQQRRSWFNGPGLFSMFSSAPSSPTDDAISPFSNVYTNDPLARTRSRSLTPLTVLTPIDTTAAMAKRPNPLVKSASKKMSFSGFLSKAAAAKRKKSTSNSNGLHSKNSSVSLTPDSFSSAFNNDDDYYFSSLSSTRRNSQRSDMRSMSDNSRETMNEHVLYNFKDEQQSAQLLELDEEEADRIQLKNDLMKLAFEGEFSLPFDYKDLLKGRILDVGCGPGSWCIDLSTRYPNIDVIGVDKDNMFPAKHNLPSNCQLIVCNVLNGLKEFPDGSFDVIHIRFMVLSFTLSQYPQVIRDCWRLLKPGGYIEILETDLAIHSPGPITKRLNEEMLELAKSRGFIPKEQIAAFDKTIPGNAIKNEVKYRSIPIGIWGGRIGVLCRDDMVNMLTRFQPAVHDFYKKPKEASFDEEIKDAVKEMDQYKSFCNYFFYTAQRPYIQQPQNDNTAAPSTTHPPSSSASSKRYQLLPQSSFTSIIHPRAL